MRYVIRWEQTTTQSATVEISLAELSTWAAATLPLRGLGILGTPETPAAERLERSLTKNSHLRDRLLQMYGAAHARPAPEPPQPPHHRRRRKLLTRSASILQLG